MHHKTAIRKRAVMASDIRDAPRTGRDSRCRESVLVGSGRGSLRIKRRGVLVLCVLVVRVIILIL